MYPNELIGQANVAAPACKVQYSARCIARLIVKLSDLIDEPGLLVQHCEHDPTISLISVAKNVMFYIKSATRYH